MNRDVFRTDPCIRKQRGEIEPTEEHFCYFCGFPIPLATGDCAGCGMMVCPRCGKCMCNITEHEYKTLEKIHLQICCNFNKLLDFQELEIEVPSSMFHCDLALKYCSDKLRGKVVG